MDFFKLEYSLIDHIDEILNYIFKSRFILDDNKDNEVIPFFDYERDFDLIFANFKKYYKIDLIKDDISWLEFTFIFEDLLLTENSLTKRIGFRSCNTPSNSDSNYNYIKNNKERYSLIPKDERIKTKKQEVSSFFFNRITKGLKK